MSARLSVVVALVLMLGLLLPAFAEEPTAPPPTAPAAPAGPACDIAPATSTADLQRRSAEQSEQLIGLFVQATSAQYERLNALLEEKYPAISDEVTLFLFTEQPDLLTGIMPALPELMATDYPEIPAIINQTIGGNDQLKLRVHQLVSEQYADFVTDLAALPRGPERRNAASELIARKYPDLYADIMDLIRKEFPDTLNEVRNKVIARYPKMLGELARLTARTFPRLTAKTVNFVVNRYPELLPQIIAILYAPPAPTEPSAPPATSAPETPPAPPPAAKPAHGAARPEAAADPAATPAPAEGTPPAPAAEEPAGANDQPEAAAEPAPEAPNAAEAAGAPPADAQATPGS